MSDFFKSAFGYISGGGVNKDENDFVGQSVELGNQKLRVKRVIAKGNQYPTSKKSYRKSRVALYSGYFC